MWNDQVLPLDCFDDIIFLLFILIFKDYNSQKMNVMLQILKYWILLQISKNPKCSCIKRDK